MSSAVANNTWCYVGVIPPFISHCSEENARKAWGQFVEQEPGCPVPLVPGQVEAVDHVFKAIWKILIQDEIPKRLDLSQERLTVERVTKQLEEVWIQGHPGAVVSPKDPDGCQLIVLSKMAYFYKAGICIKTYGRPVPCPSDPHKTEESLKQDLHFFRAVIFRLEKRFLENAERLERAEWTAIHRFLIHKPQAPLSSDRVEAEQQKQSRLHLTAALICELRNLHLHSKGDKEALFIFGNYLLKREGFRPLDLKQLADIGDLSKERLVRLFHLAQKAFAIPPSPRSSREKGGSKEGHLSEHHRLPRTLSFEERFPNLCGAGHGRRASEFPQGGSITAITEE